MARCQHCRAAPATEAFTAEMCAEGRRRRLIRLCAACDLELNRLVLEFVRARGWRAKVAAYGQRNTADAEG